MPQYCGDFAEAIHAFEVAMDRVNIERIANYAGRLGATISKRLGWVLDHLENQSPVIERLASIPIKGL